MCVIVMLAFSVLKSGLVLFFLPFLGVTGS